MTDKETQDWIKKQSEVKSCKCISCGRKEVFTDSPVCYKCRRTLEE